MNRQQRFEVEVREVWRNISSLGIGVEKIFVGKWGVGVAGRRGRR